MRFAAALFATALIVTAANGPPVTKSMPVTETLHGVTITDPYRRLEDQNSPETRAWLDRQNRYTQAYLGAIPGRDRLRQRLTEISRVDSVGTPTVRHGRYFFTRRLASENRASICMRTGFTGADQVIVNPSDAGDESFSIDLGPVSDDGSLMTYTVRHGGEDEEEIRFLNVGKHELLPFRLPRARYLSVALKPDRSGLFYARYVNGQGTRVYYHAMGTDGATDGAADREIFGSQYGADALIEIGLSEDGHYLVVSVAFGVPARKTEIYLQDLAVNGPIKPIVNDIDSDFRPFVEEGKLFLWTNWKAPNWRVLTADLKDTSREKWATVVPESEWPIDGVYAAGGRMLVSYLENVKPRIKQYSAAGKYLGDVKLPGIGTVFGFSGRWKDDESFLTYTSFVEPRTSYRYQVATGREEVWFQPKIPLNAANFDTKSGHSAGKPLNAQIDEWVSWMSFLLDQTGVKL